MNKKIKTISLNKRLLTYFLIIAILPVVVIGYFWFDSKLKDYKSEIGILKENYSSEKKHEIKSKILEVSNSIAWVQENPINSIAGCLIKQNEYLDTTISDLVLNNSIDSEFCRNVSLPVFIFNNNQELIYSFNPYCKQLDITDDAKPTILKILNENNPEDGLIVLKDSINGIDGLPLVIAFKSITDDGNEIVSIVEQKHFEDVLKCYLLDSISKLRYGRNEYIFVNTIDGKGLISNGKRNADPIDIINSNNQVWKDMFKVQQSSANHIEGVYHTYVWELLDTKKTSTKTSFFLFYPKWEWVIGTGFYEDDVNIIIDQKRELLKDDFMDTTKKILIYLFLAALLCYLLVFLFYRPINNSVVQFIQFFNRASEDNITIDKSKIKYSEFAQMADSANQMLAEAERSHEELLRDCNEITWYCQIL